MNRRRLLLTIPALFATGTAAAMNLKGLSPRRIVDPVLGEVPMCRSGIVRAQYMQGRGATEGAAADAELMEALGLLEGHMMIGRELVNAGEHRLGLPHFGHPVTELYTWLEPRIARRGAVPFDAELAALEAAAKAGAAGAALDRLYEPARLKIVALAGTVPAERAGSPGFQMEHIATMVEDVAGDYGESIERGRIVNVLEYHDSAGFLRYAIQSATAYSRKPGAPAAAWTDVLAELSAIRATAYPALLPPARPPVSISAVRARADRIRSLATRG